MTTGVDGFAVVGEVLAGKYRVDKILGIGGMGMVVAATHLEIDQRVALKFMLPVAHESPDMAARFLREARAAGRLNSEHVCRVMDVGRFDSGAPYIVMEYLHGENLAARLRRHGPLRVADAVDIVLQAIEGLAEAHAHGIVHRDLKPDNLFLAKRNDGAVTVKVLDFGISKVAVTGVVTGTGDIMGSPAYMAPEQMQASRDVDQRADVWSLGVVLYQIVVGKLPFQGDSLPLLCLHVVNDAPLPMSAVRGDLPDGFEAVVMKCLGKEPVDRYVDVGELAAALVGFGPKHATTSVSRIQSVLARSRGDGAATISHEFSTIAPTLDHDPAVLAALGASPEPPGLRGAPLLPSTQRPTGPQSVPVLPSSRRPTGRQGQPLLPSTQRLQPAQSTTLSSTSGQALGRLREPNRPWRMIGAIAGAVGLVAVLVAILARSGVAPDAVVDEPGHASHAPAASSPSGPGGSAPGASAAKPVSGADATRAGRPADGLGSSAAAQTITVEPIEPPDARNGSAEPSGTLAPATAPPGDARLEPANASTPGPSATGRAADPVTGAGAASPPDRPARKKRPRRPSAGAPQRAPADPAAPDDDDAWTHMTHDEKTP